MFESYGYEKIRTSKKVVASHAVAHRSGREGRSSGSCGHRVCAPVVAVPPRQPPRGEPLPRGRAATAGARSGAGPAQGVPTRGEGAGAAEEGLGVCVWVCPRVGEAKWPSPRVPLSGPLMGPGLDESGIHPRGCSQAEKLALGGEYGPRSRTVRAVPRFEVFCVRSSPPRSRPQW